MYVVNLTTPANYFHALRRQLKTNYRKPLIVMSPKTLLRDVRARSKFEEMNPSQPFMPVIDELKMDPNTVERVMFCSGKVYYDLAQQRDNLGYHNTAIVRIEELAPFPLEGVTKTLEKYRNAKEYLWVQDEVQNGGAWLYMQPRLNSLIGVTSTAYGFLTFNSKLSNTLDALPAPLQPPASEWSSRRNRKYSSTPPSPKNNVTTVVNKKKRLHTKDFYCESIEFFSVLCFLTDSLSSSSGSSNCPSCSFSIIFSSCSSVGAINKLSHF
jgi:hypothetical protein